MTVACKFPSMRLPPPFDPTPGYRMPPGPKPPQVFVVRCGCGTIVAGECLDFIDLRKHRHTADIGRMTIEGLLRGCSVAIVDGPVDMSPCGCR
jgi:hypothetical protein